MFVRKAKSTYLALVVIFMFVLVHQGNAVDFHLFRNYSLGMSNSNIMEFKALGINTIGLQEGDLTNCTVKVLTGADFQSELFKSTQTNLVIQPKFNTTNSVLTSKGMDLTDKFFANEQKITGYNISGNSLFMPDGFLYFSSNKLCPTLNKYNISSQEDTTNSYEQGTNCSFYSSGYLAPDVNQQIAYAARNKIYFVDSQLNLQTTYQQPQPTIQYEYSYINSYVNETSQQSAFMVQYMDILSSNYRLIQKNATNITASYQFFSPTSPIVLTNLTSGASMYDSDIYHWQNLQTPFLTIDYANLSQSLEMTSTVAVSPDQKLFVQANFTGDWLIGYEFNADGDYAIKKMFQVQVPNTYYIFSGFFSKNGDVLIFDTINTNQFLVPCRLNITSLEVVCLSDYRSEGQKPDAKQLNLKANKDNKVKEQRKRPKLIRNQRNQKLFEEKLDQRLKDKITKNKNKVNMEKQKKFSQKRFEPKNLQAAGYFDCQTYAIFSDIDRVLLFCYNYSSEYFEQFQLYSISQFKYIGTSKLYFPPNIDLYRIVINQYKQVVTTQDLQSFLVICRYYSDYYFGDQTVTFKYTIQNDQFRVSTALSNEISIWNVYAFGNYVASMKFANATYQSDNLAIYDYTNFRLMTKIPYDYASIPGAYVLEGKKNILLVDQMFEVGSNDVFDLSQLVGSSTFFRGMVIPQYFSNYPIYTSDGLKIIFPQTYYLYYYRFSPSATYEPYKQVYDIKYPPIKDTLRMFLSPTSNITLFSYQLSKYFPAEPNVPGLQCPLAFSIVNSKYLMKFKDCAPYTAGQLYDLDPLNRYNFYDSIYHDIYLSTSKKNIVLSYQYQYYLNEMYISYVIVEVRSLSNPNQIIWSSSRPKSALTANEDYNVQFVTYYDYGNNMESINLIGYQDNLLTQNTINTVDLNAIDIMKIDDVFVNPKCYAIAGKSITTPTDSTIFISKQTPSQNSSIPLPNDSVYQLLLSEDCNTVAYLTTKQWIIVQDITDLANPQLLIKELVWANYIAFVGVDRLLVNNSYGINIINFFDSVREEIKVGDEKLTLKQKKNVKLGYTPIIAVSKDGTLVATTLSYNSVQINMTLNGTQTELVRNFYVPSDASGQYIAGLSFDDNNTLLVALGNGMLYQISNTPCPYTYVNNNTICMCTSNQTELLSQCQCLPNFVANYTTTTLYCTCPTSFTYTSSDDSCTCPYGYVESQECIACSFPCETCTAGGFNCQTYVVGFYVIVIVGSFVVAALIIGGIIFAIRRKRMKDRLLEPIELDDDKV